MRIFKTRLFHRWAMKVGIDNVKLVEAVKAMNDGHYEANLGGCLFKKRIAWGHLGKRGGFRTIIVFTKNDKAFFIYGYAKNVQSNMTIKEKKIYKKLAGILLAYDNKQLNVAIRHHELIEV
jgi:hypothetical protein